MRALFIGLAFTLSALRADAAPVPSNPDKFPPPHIIMQTASVKHWLAEMRKAATILAPTPEQIQELDNEIKKAISDEKKAGILLDQPLGGYFYFRPKLDDSVIVFALPISNQADAIQLAERLEMRVTIIDQKKKLYTVKFADTLWHLKFTNDTAYLATCFAGRNDQQAEYKRLGNILDDDQLIPLSRLINAKEKAPLVANLFIPRIPEANRKQLNEVLEMLVAEAGQIVVQPDLQGSVQKLATEASLALQRNVKTALQEGADLRLEVETGKNNFEYAYNFSLVPQDKTELAKDIAAFGKSTGRAAALATPDTIGGGWITLPKELPKGLRQAAGATLGDSLRTLRIELPESALPLFDEVVKQLETNVKEGAVDVGFALHKPEKAKLYTGVALLELNDPGSLLKGILKSAVAGEKGLPKEVRDRIQLNAAKVGDMAVHTIRIGDLLPEELQKLVGAKAELHFAFDKKAILFAIGPDSLAELKRVQAIKPAECRTLEVAVNLEKVMEMKKVMTPDRPQQPRRFMAFEKMDYLAPMLSFDTHGGKELKVRFGLSGMYVGMMGFIFIN